MSMAKLERMEREAEQKIRQVRAVKLITESLVGNEEVMRKVIALLSPSDQKKITGVLDGEVRKKSPKKTKEAKDEE